MDTKFEQFAIALRNLCAEHEVVLTAPGSDIVVIDAGAKDAELVRAAVFDATEEPRPPELSGRRTMTVVTDVLREAMWIAAEQPQNFGKSASEMRELAMALFGEELVKAALNG